jgi:hypothetical protein
VSEGGVPVYSFVSKSQIGYTRRVKEKMAWQLQKRVVCRGCGGNCREGGGELFGGVVQEAVKFASIMRLSCGEGGDEESLLNFFRLLKRSEIPIPQR